MGGLKNDNGSPVSMCNAENAYKQATGECIKVARHGIT